MKFKTELRRRNRKQGTELFQRQVNKIWKISTLLLLIFWPV